MKKLQLLKTKKWTCIGFLTVLCLSFMVLLILAIENTIEWNWLFGWLFVSVFVIVAFFIDYLSPIMLVKTNNHYLYVFFFILKIGIYFIPFAIAYYMQNIFSMYGAIVGLVPVLLMPIFLIFDRKILGMINLEKGG